MKKKKPAASRALCMAWVFGLLWAGTLVYTFTQPAKLRTDLGEARDMKANWKKWYFHADERVLYWMRRNTDRQIEVDRYKRAVEHLSAKCDHCWHAELCCDTPYPDKTCCWCKTMQPFKGTAKVNGGGNCHGEFKL